MHWYVIDAGQPVRRARALHPPYGASASAARADHPLGAPRFVAGEKGVGRSGKPLHFKGSAFHRVIPQFMCQVSPPPLAWASRAVITAPDTAAGRPAACSGGAADATQMRCARWTQLLGRVSPQGS